MAKFSSSLSKVNSETILIIIVIIVAIIVVVYFLNKKQECFGNININNLPQCTTQQLFGILASSSFPNSSVTNYCILNDACLYQGYPYKCVPSNPNSYQTTWKKYTNST